MDKTNKKRRRRKGESTTSSPEKMYFTPATQESIVRFQSEQDPNVRKTIFNDEILPAIKKLTENLIMVYKFTTLHETQEEMQNDCINFLFESLHKFDASRGTNAFSYFNVVAKNWLVMKTKQRLTKLKKMVSIEESNHFSFSEKASYNDHNQVMSVDEIYESKQTPSILMSLFEEVRSNVKSENELLAINAIITIFSSVHEIDYINKTAILLYMRELTGLSPKQLTTAMQGIKKLYKAAKLKLENEGHEVDDESFFG